MATVDDLARAIMDQEGSVYPGTTDPKPGSVNYTINQKYGMWNVGHLVWASQPGAVSVVTKTGGREWAAWPTFSGAYQGLVRQITLDMNRGLTLEQFIAKYAPPNENNTSAYLEFVKGRLGMSGNTLLSALRPAGSNPTPAPVAPKPPEPVQAGGRVQKLKRCPACGQTLPEASKT